MNVESNRENYPEGTRIRLNSMCGEDIRRMPPGLKGVVTHVDDIGQIHVKWENGSTLALNTDADTFEKMPDDHKLKVLLVPVGKIPRVVEINDELEDMQKLVGGYIEEYMPFDEDVAIICNEEGKFNGMKPNRAVRDDEHDYMDIIYGDFFLVLAPIDDENFKSLPADLVAKYQEIFKTPERLVRENGVSKMVPMTPQKDNRER